MGIKVFVATSIGQGVRKSDFFNSTEGEWVKLGFEEDGEKIDGSCGCRRSVVGVDSLKASTTFTVQELPDEMTLEQVIERFKQSDIKAGWIPGETAQEVAEFEEEYKRWIGYASRFPVGEILEKRGDKIQTRWTVAEVNIWKAKNPTPANVAENMRALANS